MGKLLRQSFCKLSHVRGACYGHNNTHDHTPPPTGNPTRSRASKQSDRRGKVALAVPSQSSAQGAEIPKTMSAWFLHRGFCVSGGTVDRRIRWKSSRGAVTGAL